jgi:hypothetical protein
VNWVHLTQNIEHGEEPSASIKGGKFLEMPSDYQLL